MGKKLNWLRKGSLFGLNITILSCLFLVSTIVFYGPQSLRGQDNLIIPDDSLVYEGKLLDFNLTKIANELIVEGHGESTVYLVNTDTEVLSNATVELGIPTLNFQTNLSEVSSGVYSVTLPENLIITPQAEGISASEIADWKIQPLEYSLSVNSKTKSASLNLSPIKISTLETGLDLTLRTNLLETRVVDYIPTAGIANLATTPNTYELSVNTTFKAKVIDIDGVPIASQTITVTLELPNHTYAEAVTVATDANGVFSYSRTEKALLTVSGGRLLTLASPLQIQGASFPVMVLNWGGNGNGGETRKLKGDMIDPTKEDNGKPKAGENEAGEDPINLTTGNMYHIRQDLFIPANGHPVDFTRTYNSRDTYEGPFGYGWTHSYHIFLKEDTSGNVREREEDGNLIVFTKNPDGTYTSPPGNHDTLTKNSYGYTLRRKHGTIYNFNTSGKLTTITDPNGNNTSLTYTGADLTGITDASDRQINLVYDANHRIISLTDPLGRQTSYSYDSSNNLISSTDPLGNTTEYSYHEDDYDDDHNLTQITDPRGNHRYITYDKEHRATSFSYDGNNHKITLAYDPDNKKTTVTDSKGTETIYYYTVISDIRLVTKIVEPTGNIQLFNWDSDLNKISSTDQNDHTTNMSYDNNGNLTSITDPLANTTNFAYELTYNKVTNITDALSNVTTYAYDGNGNLLEVTDAKLNKTIYTYDSYGNMSSFTDANNNSIDYEYDTYGNLITTTDSLLNQTNFTYDLIGNCTQVTDAKGSTTSFAYDDLNRLIVITYQDATKVTYAYDEAGNLTSITDPKGNITTYEYDVVNRLYKVVDPLGGQTNYAYDTEGNRVGITDTNRNTTRYSYNNVNRLIEVTTPLLMKKQFSYDAAGNRTSATDANGNTINYTYDATSRLIQIIYPDTSTISFTYDATGKRISMTDGQGTTTYTYDELNRLIQVDGPDAYAAISYTCDNVGNRIKMNDQNGGVTTYEYDSLNRLIRLTNPQAETTTYKYDEVNNLTEMNYPNLTQTTYSYDNLNRLITLVNAQATGSPKDEIISSYLYQYDASGMRTKVTLDNGEYILYSYDKLNRLTKEVKKMGDSGRTFYSYSYSYDPIGNRTYMSRQLYQLMPSAGRTGKAGVSPGLSSEDLAGINEYNYTYNKDNQLLTIGITRSTRIAIPATVTSSKKASNFKAGELLVKFIPGTDEETINSINAKYGTTIMKVHKLGVLRLKINTGAAPQTLVTAYQSEPAVEYAEPNFLIHILLTPNDPDFNQQWGLDNTGQTGGIPDSDIDAPEAWDIETGDPSLVIAIVDTGVDGDHPDLAGKVLPGYDFVNDDDIAQDDHGHGTFVAGIVAAITDNNIGVAGMSWYNQILPVKVMNSSGTGTHADLADGIIYAADNGADVINLSIGDPFSSTILENAIKYAYDMGVVNVAAVGNDGGPVLYPAAYDDYVLGVAATDHNDERATFPDWSSNFGPEVDVAAPGVNIYSTLWNDTYSIRSGTSASTPFVSGLAGLILSENPKLTPEQVMNQIKSTSQDVNQANLPGEDDHIGSGRINAYNALSIVSAEKVITQADIEYAYDNNGNQITKTIHKAAANPSVTTYTYDYENRLTTITYPDSSTSEYTYDGVGKRIQSMEEGQITRYLYDGLSAIIERNASDLTQVTYTRGLGYGGGIGGIISALQNGNTYYYHYDGIGSVTGLTDQTGKTVQSYTYDAFGNILTQNGLVQNPYGFSTKEYNSKSGLIYFGARYYDPRVGRWITRDPLGMVDGPNVYVYCSNNPVNWIDPWGLWRDENKLWWERLKDWLVPEAEAYESPWPGGNTVIEKVISDKIKEYVPEMPKDLRKEIAEKFREEMTKDEYKKLKDKNTPDTEKAKIVEDVINRLRENPENRELEEKVKPYFEDYITK